MKKTKLKLQLVPKRKLAWTDSKIRQQRGNDNKNMDKTLDCCVYDFLSDM